MDVGKSGNRYTGKSSSSTPVSPLLVNAGSEDGALLFVAYPHKRIALRIGNRIFTQVLSTSVLDMGVDGDMELCLRDFTLCLNAAEELRILLEVSTKSADSQLSSSAACTGAESTMEDVIASTIAVDSSFFFALAHEAYELSRDPLACPRRNERCNIWRRGGHCAAFALCVRIFAKVYDINVRPRLRPSLRRFRSPRCEDLFEYRRSVMDAFHLVEESTSPLQATHGHHSGTTATTVLSTSNLRSRWELQNIRRDQYFFPSGAGPSASMADMTMSYIPAARRSAASSVAAVNPPAVDEVPQTFGLTELLTMPSWEPEDASASCRRCGQLFFKLSCPRGARSHHCRACGRRLCDRCITKRAHRSFAKLRKPGLSTMEGEERLVCDDCHVKYLTLERLRYLGALFAMAGLDFSHLALCRTVTAEWQQAAELCISEHRLLLHTCEPDFASVLTPVGVLLQNSLHLIVSAQDEVYECNERGGGACGATVDRGLHAQSLTFLASPGSLPVRTGLHPEAALMLLKYIAEEKLWEEQSSHVFVRALTSADCSAKLAFSHWHFYCTTSCCSMNPVYFFMKVVETMGTTAVMAAHLYVREAVKLMVTDYLASLAALGDSTEGGGWNNTGGESRDDDIVVAERELVSVWLLDLLKKDSMAPANGRQYSDLLEMLIPPLVAGSTRIAIMMLMSMKAIRTRGWGGVGGDRDVVSPWATVMLDEVRETNVERCRLIEAGIQFFAELDAFCINRGDMSDTVALQAWIASYATMVSKNAGTMGLNDGGAGGTAAAAAATSSKMDPRYADLPEPFYHLFKPWIVLRSVYLPGVKVVPSSTRPVWICFSSATSAQWAQKPDRRSPRYRFLYKREDVQRDQLMCISSRLTRLLLRKDIGDTVSMPNYSAMPISPYSGLIEEAEGYVLSDLRDTSSTGANGVVNITTFIRQRGGADVHFLASAKLFLLLNYIFSIGDRHQGNVMISSNGAIFHIDFGFLFSEKTLVEKFAGTTMRIDGQFLQAAAFCRRKQRSTSGEVKGSTAFAPPTTEENSAFFAEAAQWLITVRPHVALFYRLWLYAVHQGTLPFNEEFMATTFNMLFDRTASQASCREQFIETMNHSIYACRLKDATHSSAQVLKSYGEHLSNATKGGTQQAAKLLWSVWDTWRSGAK